MALFRRSWRIWYFFSTHSTFLWKHCGNDSEMLQNTGPLWHFMAASAVFVSTHCWGPESTSRLCSVSALLGALAVGAQTSSEMMYLGCVSKSSGKPRSLHWGAVLELEPVPSAALRTNQGLCLDMDLADASFLGLALEVPQHCSSWTGAGMSQFSRVVWPTRHSQHLAPQVFMMVCYYLLCSVKSKYIYKVFNPWNISLLF